MTLDEMIAQLLAEGKIRVDLERGLVFSNRQRPDRPLGNVSQKGYLTTTLMFQGKQYKLCVHRIVAIAAYGVPDPGLDTAHLNHDKTDNRAENLAFVTPQENMRQTVEAGNMTKGEDHHSAKLTRDDVRAIRESYAQGQVSLRDLADEYGVSWPAIRAAVTGRTWKDVPGPLSRKGQSKGEQIANAKLTTDGVREIRETYAQGEVTQQELAAQYGVSRTSIHRAVTGENWKDAPGPLSLPS